MKRPLKAYLDGYQSGIANGGDWFRIINCTRRYQRAYKQGVREGIEDRERIERGERFLSRT